MPSLLNQAGATARVRSVMADPAFAMYLLALLTLPLRWLSPIASLYEHAEWSDIFVAIAVLLWLLEAWRRHALRTLIRPWHLPLLLFLLFGVASATASSQSRSTSWGTVLLMCELVALAAITADFAGDRMRRRLIARTIVVSALVTVALAVLGLALFYAGVHSGLIGPYGEQYVPSHLYARVQAGFESPPLLASYCIFASGIVASEDAALPVRLRLAGQGALFFVCAITFSRGLIGFVLAAVIRGSARLRGRARWIVPVAATALGLAIIGVLTAGRLHLNPSKPSTFSYSAPDPGNRREAFVSSLHTVGHHPLLGIGPGALPGLNLGEPFRAHFTPLNVAATLGVPALLALLAALFAIWRRRVRPTDVALWSAAAGIALDGLAQDIDHFRHVWVLLGLLARDASVAPTAADRSSDGRRRRLRLTHEPDSQA